METHVILPGEIEVTDNPSIELRTCVGSCVAVAMYDHQVRIGGLAHIMLPQASDKKEKARPALYARSGIPLLLNKMIKSGASKDRIVAAVAGGSLILTDRKLGVELNIGRRNINIVQQVISSLGIPIVRQDTGGYFGRVLKLNLEDGLIDIREVKEKKQKDTESEIVGDIKLEDFKNRIDKLKPVPDIARMIISRIKYSGTSSYDLEKYIIKDPALTANVLKLCNSLDYGFQKQIHSIRRAGELLNPETFKNIVLDASGYNLYEDTINGYSLENKEMLNHSLCCAKVARLISQEKKINNPDVIFTAGLLHDIGKVILDQYFFEKFNLIMDKIINEDMQFIDAENEILGYNHAQVGEIVAMEWNLPGILVESISLHHQPEKTKGNPEVVSIIHIADCICSMIGYGGGANIVANQINRSAISCINLQSDDVDKIIEKLPEVLNLG
ncbi:MAG: HDOD domain-containing protein [Proteobacteria bacterium]|nr:HDOD domain-containing protein [Pseudomonadota bacterium]MBU4288825.1 HDOD domain-containing protein [Pseudomonadota bacterium]MBU4415476.1 HDOD domain-containing protein [Pseudomonadota bacterium]MCG2757447.1 HDOD domain-containing protein [Desulfobacteraceae bacterium]